MKKGNRKTAISCVKRQIRDMFDERMNTDDRQDLILYHGRDIGYSEWKNERQRLRDFINVLRVLKKG